MPRVQKTDSLSQNAQAVQAQTLPGIGPFAGSAVGGGAQVRRPVPQSGSGNAFAEESQEEGSVMNRSRPPRQAMAPPRKDSLGARRLEE